MKRIIYVLLALILSGIIHLNAQNSTCAATSGGMKVPSDTVNTCFAGYTGSNTGALNQCYTFTAFYPNINIALTPVLGTACSFPNTAVNYSGFELYLSTDCANPVATGTSFTNLTVGEDYTFCLTMTPADPSCVWISQACPEAQKGAVLGINNLLNYELNGNEMRLYWHTLPEFSEYRLYEAGEDAQDFRMIASWKTEQDREFQYGGWIKAGEIRHYRLERITDAGAVSWSNTVRVESEQGAAMIWPNPWDGESQLHLQLPADEIMAARLIMTDGRAVKLHAENAADLAKELSSFHTLLPAGKYILQLVTRSGMENMPLIIMTNRSSL